MSTSISTIEAYMQALPEAKTWLSDPLVSPIPWRPDECTIPNGKKLKIGVIIDDGMVRPQPPILRAMEDLVTSLRSSGHEGELL
jgi:amidase